MKRILSFAVPIIALFLATFLTAADAPKQPAAGTAAPDFSLTSGDGAQVSLKDFRGKWVVLYFYPKDDTPGCTAQACGLRDAWSEFDGRAQIFGVSIDSTASHGKFIAKY